ncbi:MAG TPA: ABC transporter substrate-binding protein [Chloroflexota bacterium]|nr:ABC transporter substrate-binding protein [Chloroflexota bacterium]
MKSDGRRRVLQGGLALAGLGLLSGCGFVSLPGQRQASLRRIGYLTAGLGAPTVEAFREGMRDLRYVEGENLLIEYRDAQGYQERLPALAAELVSMPVEVIIAYNVFAIVAASRATSVIPIVATGANVVGAGLVTNIARPEGNITGVALNGVETVGKWIELLKQTVPTISRLAVVLDRSGPAAEANLQQVQRATQSLQLQHTSYDLRDLDQLSAVLSTARADGADSLMIVSGGVLAGGADPRIGGAALKARLPAVAESRLFAVAGGLVAHGTDTLALARRSATYVDKILRGARPGDLPIELPTEFIIVVNLKSAQELGVLVPQSVLQQTTEVIQ